MCSSQANKERVAVGMGKFHSTVAVCAVGPHNTPHLTQLLNGALKAGAEVKCPSTLPIKTILSEATKLQM